MRSLRLFVAGIFAGASALVLIRALDELVNTMIDAELDAAGTDDESGAEPGADRPGGADDDAPLTEDELVAYIAGVRTLLADPDAAGRLLRLLGDDAAAAARELSERGADG